MDKHYAFSVNLVGGTAACRELEAIKRQRHTADHVPTSAAALYADVMPEDETPDMLIDAVERWRRGDG